MITKKKKREELQYLRDEALQAYQNRPDFQYDANEDALYRLYKDQYTELGQKAMTDTMGQAAALTGGYGSSYAQNVGQQAYQNYLGQLDDVIPALYQLAYDRYQDKGNDLYKTYQSWAQQEQQAAQQEQWAAQQAALQEQQAMLQEQWAAEQALQQERWAAEQAALQEQWAAEHAAQQERWAAQQALQQEQWNREYELAKRKQQEASRRQEQERKNSRTQTSTSQPDYWAMLAYHQKLGLNTQRKETAAEPEYDNGNVSEGNIKTMQRVLGLQETGKWSEKEHQKAGNLNADDAWKSYQRGQLQNRTSHGQWEQGATVGNIKTMERVLGLEEDGYWSGEDKKAAGGLTAFSAWKGYQQGKLQSRSRSGMSMDEWAELKQAQSTTSGFNMTQTSDVREFIGQMMTKEQAATRGITSKEWEAMVIDRLNHVKLSAVEFNQLETYYGLDVEGRRSGATGTADTSNQKMFYAEYREKTAAKRVADLQTEVQQYFRAYQAFANSAVYDSQYVDYQNAAFMLESRIQTAAELRKRADALLTSLETSADIISGDYSELLAQISSTREGVDSIMDVFEKQANYYSRWDTEDAFNKAIEQAEADKKRWTDLTGGYDPIKNKEEGKAGWEAYVAEKEQSAQRAAEAEAKKASEGYTWEQFWDDLGRWMGPGVNPDTSLPFHTDVQLIAQGYRDEEAAKRVPDERWTDEQRYTFGYIWKGSRQKAGDYAYAINNMLNIQQEQEQLQQIKEWSTANIAAGVLSTAGAILAAPVGMADFLGDIIQSGTLGYIPEADGQITPFEFSQGVTSGISQHLNTEYGTLNEDIPIIGGKGWGDVYGLGTSIAQSSLAAATGGPGQALISFFGSAAAAGVDDAASRGASADQAVAYGTMVGLAEALAEMIGVDNLMKIGSSATVKQLVWNILKQGAAEGIEEGVTSVLNNFADNLIMGDKSNFNILVSEYMNQGMDEKGAKKKAWMNMAGDIAFDMLGGFVSGEVHAGPLTSISYAKTQNQYTKTGSSIMDADGGLETLMSLANEVAGVSSAQMQNTLTNQINKVSQNPTARNVGQLNATVQAANNQTKTSVGQFNATVQTANKQVNSPINHADVAKSLMSKGVSSKQAEGIADAIVARLNGQELTRPQRNLLNSALKSSAVRDTISECINRRKTSTAQPSPEQRCQVFSETAVLPEQYEQVEKSWFAREHGGAVEKVPEALNTTALRSVGKNDFAQVKIDSIKDVSWHKNVGASKWGSKKLCLLFEAEQKSVNRETERAVLFGANGEVVLQKDGERGRVCFTNAEISKMRGGTLTHNHPNSSCFSPEDIHTLFNAKLSEIRAVTSDGVFRLQKPIKWPAQKYNLEMIERIYYDIDKEICSPLYGKAYSGEISFAEAEKIGQIEVIKEFAKRHGLAFEFETWEDMRRRFNGSVY